MFTVAVVEDEADAARRLEACLARYSGIIRVCGSM